MAVFYILIVIIGAILNAILFWKVWNMCDNVAKITKKLCENSENTNIAKTICESTTATENNEQSTPKNKSNNCYAEVITAVVLGFFALLIILLSIMKGC